jgi:hypothetical protein
MECICFGNTEQSVDKYLDGSRLRFTKLIMVKAAAPDSWHGSSMRSGEDPDARTIDPEAAASARGSTAWSSVISVRQKGIRTGYVTIGRG